MLGVSVNPLRSSIKLQILLLCFYTFLIDVVGRSCSNINRVKREIMCCTGGVSSLFYEDLFLCLCSSGEAFCRGS